MSDDPCVIKSFPSETEAHLARSKLATAGIQATVHRFSRYRAIASGGYLLKTRPEHVARARAILRKLDKEIDLDEYVSSDDESYNRCPRCDSVNVRKTPLPPKVLALSLCLVGIPFLFMKRDWMCRKCGHTWKE
jgi:rubrerythrin